MNPCIPGLYPTVSQYHGPYLSNLTSRTKTAVKNRKIRKVDNVKANECEKTYIKERNNDQDMNKQIKIVIEYAGLTYSTALKRDLPFGILKETFSRKFDVDASGIRLLINGEQVMDDATVDSINMDIFDKIEVVKKQEGGGRRGGRCLKDRPEEIAQLLDDMEDKENRPCGLGIAVGSTPVSRNKPLNKDKIFKISNVLSNIKDLTRLKDAKIKRNQYVNNVVCYPIDKEVVCKPIQKKKCKKMDSLNTHNGNREKHSVSVPSAEQCSVSGPSNAAKIAVVGQKVVQMKEVVSNPYSSDQIEDLCVNADTTHLADLGEDLSLQSSGASEEYIQHSYLPSEGCSDKSSSLSSDHEYQDLSLLDALAEQKRKGLLKEAINIENSISLYLEHRFKCAASVEYMILCLREDYTKGNLRSENPWDSKIIVYLRSPRIDPSEFDIIKIQLIRKILMEEVSDKISRNVVQEKKKVHNNKRCDKSPAGNEQNVMLLNVEEDSSMSKLSGCNGILHTPSKRIKLFEDFSLKAPSPLSSTTLVSEEELKRLSVAVHLLIEKQKGDIAVLKSLMLTIDHFEELQTFAGVGSLYNLVKSRPVKEYLSIWRKFFCGEDGLHYGHKPYCPYDHCKSGLFSPYVPLEADLISFYGKAGSHNDSSGLPVNRALFRENSSIRNVIAPQKSRNKQEEDIFVLDAPNEGSLDVAFKVPAFHCPNSECKSSFTSKGGLEKHVSKHHKEIKLDNGPQFCVICNHSFKCLDRHVKRVHKKLLPDRVCPVCQDVIVGKFSDHRAKCNKCPYCPKRKRKDRLLDHIKKCELKNAKPLDLTSPQKSSTNVESVDLSVPEVPEDMPLDLTSPQKSSTNVESVDLSVPKVPEDMPLDLSPCSKTVYKVSSRKDNTTGMSQGEGYVTDEARTDSSASEYNIAAQSSDSHDAVSYAIDKIQNSNKVQEESESAYNYAYSSNELGRSEDNGDNEDGQSKEAGIDLNKNHTDFPNRLKYPLANTNDSDDYVTEEESSDTTTSIKERREVKNNLELALREIDKLVDETKNGEAVILNQFHDYMVRFTPGIIPKTLEMHKSAVKRDIFPVFYKMFSNFDCSMLLDGLTPKNCYFNGLKPHEDVNPTDPIYITPRIFREALVKYDGITEVGQQKANLIAGGLEFMKFIEFYFLDNEHLLGERIKKKVLDSHDAVRSFIRHTNQWKRSNHERKAQLQKSKDLQYCLSPNKASEILEKYHMMLKSPLRRENINFVLRLSRQTKISDADYDKVTRIIMEECVLCSGYRPLAIYGLPNDGYYGKTPGFLPYLDTSEDDRVAEEIKDEMVIWRRTDPNMPPKRLACQHQLENRSPFCPVRCDEEHPPDGFNINCTWDKNRATVGPSYLHISKPTKQLMDMYVIIKETYFAGKKTTLSSGDESWLSEGSTPFFLKSSGLPYKEIAMKYTSEIMGMHITAYDIRDIVVSWALNHKSRKIREAEGTALHHGKEVAKEFYLNNKKSQPQDVAQQFTDEEQVYPDELKEELAKAVESVNDKIALMESKRVEMRKKTLLEEKKARKWALSECQPLGPKCRILFSLKREFKDIFEKLSDMSMEEAVEVLKPHQWRNRVVRMVCTAKGEIGEKLREVWKNAYKGDLRFGIRDLRREHREKGWPRPDPRYYLFKKDRNTYIAGSFLKAFKSDKEKGFIRYYDAS